MPQYVFLKRSQSSVGPQNSFFYHGDTSAFHVSSHCSLTSSTENMDLKTFRVSHIQIIVTQRILLERAQTVQWCIIVPIKKLRELQSAAVIMKRSQKRREPESSCSACTLACAEPCRWLERRAMDWELFIVHQFPCLRIELVEKQTSPQIPFDLTTKFPFNGKTRCGNV